MQEAFWTAVGVTGGAYLIYHLYRFNRRRCPSCEGSGKRRSGVFSERYRTCSRCGGSGEIRGWIGRKTD